jgi:hypothetical protein
MHWSEERECTECGMILPVNDLTKFTETRVAGWARGGPGTNPLRDVDLFLCGYCTDLRVRPGWGKRLWIASRPMLISTALVTGLFVAAVLILPGASDDGADVRHAAPVQNGSVADPNLMMMPAPGEIIAEGSALPSSSAAPVAAATADPAEAIFNGSYRSDADNGREDAAKPQGSQAGAPGSR